MKLNQNAFSIGDKLYILQKRWSVISDKNQIPSVNPLFSLSPNPIHNLFIVNAYPGVTMCENYKQSSSTLELSTKEMHIVSMQLSGSSSPEAVMIFTNGLILRINVQSRYRSQIVWLNTMKKMYSKSLPVQVRWVSDTCFAVRFKDNLIWFFSAELKEESAAVARVLRKSLAKHDHFSVSENFHSKNPREVWRFNFAQITNFEFSEDSELFFLTTIDGQLKVFNYTDKTYLVTFFSYFAGLNSIAVNLQLSLVAVGGEDDSISVWNYREKKLVGRCQGHFSWVTSIAFGRTSKLFSSGMDGRVLVFELTEAMKRLNGQVENGHLIPYPKDFLVINYKKELFCHSNPIFDIGIKENDFFVCDDCGKIWMWTGNSKYNK